MYDYVIPSCSWSVFWSIVLNHILGYASSSSDSEMETTENCKSSYQDDSKKNSSHKSKECVLPEGMSIRYKYLSFCLFLSQCCLHLSFKKNFCFEQY